MKPTLRIFCALLVAAALVEVMQVKVSAQITAASDGTRTLVNQSGNAFDITGGTRAGGNLFHSFQQFGLNQGQTANFLSNPAIQNILGRVTGGNASVINGLIKVTGGNSNFYLMNPAGIIFGANASLNVPGSFTATTANGVGLGCQGTGVGCAGWFNAIGDNNYAALTGMPDRLAFTMTQPGTIVNAGDLTVGQGQTLSLIGGSVVNTGSLSGGKVMIAAVPGSSLVKLSQPDNLLSLEFIPPSASPTTPSPLPFTPLTLPQLLTGGNLSNATGMTVNGDGSVSLSGSGVQVTQGDVVAKRVTAETATLSASNNLTLVESQLHTTGNLNLLAQNTVRVKDSQLSPVVIQADGKLVIQGNQQVDIFALNHPSSLLVSGGDMVLRSPQPIAGDAHYITGGNLKLETLDGNVGNLFSPYDPIILAAGDVTLGDYTGGSLHILAGGNVTLGNVVIDNTTPPLATGANTINPTNTASYNGNPANTFASLAQIRRADGSPVLINPTPIFVNSGGIANNIQRVGGTPLVIDGRNPTLDVRAGVNWAQLGGLPTNLGIGIATSPSVTPSGSNISINTIRVNGVFTTKPGFIFLTNQYYPNTALPAGNIQVNGSTATAPIASISCTVCSSPGAGEGAVVIDSRGNVEFGRLFGNPSVNVSITAVGNITTGNIEASAFLDSERQDNIDNPTSVLLRSTTGNIRVGAVVAGAHGIDISAAGLFQATGFVQADFGDGQVTPSGAGTPIGDFLISKGISPPPSSVRLFLDNSNVSLLSRPVLFTGEPVDKPLSPITIRYGDASRTLINDTASIGDRTARVIIQGGNAAFYAGPQVTGKLVPGNDPYVMRVFPSFTYETVTPANFSGFSGFTVNQQTTPLVFGSADFPIDASGVAARIAIGSSGNASLYGSTQSVVFPAIITNPGGGGGGGSNGGGSNGGTAGGGGNGNPGGETNAGRFDGQAVQRQFERSTQASACNPNTIASNATGTRAPEQTTRAVSASNNPCAAVSDDAQILKILDDSPRQ